MVFWEPLQTATSTEGQIAELHAVLQQNANLPVTLIGYSWGAWLGFLFAAAYPACVNKLILIASGPYTEEYVTSLQNSRFDRLNEAERTEVASLRASLQKPDAGEKHAELTRLGELFSKAASYDPIRDAVDTSTFIDARADIFLGVMAEATELRRSRKLLQSGEHIQCPVVAIHGDYDPHPAEGVQKPLSAILKSFRFILLKNCGHKPWIEREAREAFYRTLKEESC